MDKCDINQPTSTVITAASRPVPLPINADRGIQSSHHVCDAAHSGDIIHLCITKRTTKRCNSSSSHNRENNRSNTRNDEDAGDDTLRISCEAPPKHSECNYNPLSTKRVIKMSKHLTQHMIPQRIKESIVDAYDFIIKLTAISLYDNHVCDVGDSMVLNYGFHDRNSNAVLYLVATKQFKRNRVYKMCDQMYTKHQICCVYGLQEYQLPKSCFFMMRRMMMMNRTNYVFEVDYRSVHWHKLPVFRTTNKKEASKYNKQRLTFFITKTEFIRTATPTQTLIPIIMFNGGGYRMEYVQIVRFGNGIAIDIGVSYFYNQRRDRFQATAIHLSPHELLRQHQLADPHHKCHCLDGFQSIVNDLHIGNPDDDKNRVKDLQKKNDILKSILQANMDNMDPLKYENERLKILLAQTRNSNQALRIEVNCLRNIVMQSPIQPALTPLRSIITSPVSGYQSNVIP